MREELASIFQFIDAESLPQSFSELFEGIYDPQAEQFSLQENVLLDYKEGLPKKGDEDYRSGLLKLIAAFHNVYGGLIVFGVRDDDFKPVGVESDFDIEKFNSLASHVFETDIELIRRIYSINVDGYTKKIIVLLIPRRRAVRPCIARKDYGQIKHGKLYIRERHEAKTASNHHIPLLFSLRETPFSGFEEDISGIQFSAPPSPSTLPDFIGREGLTLRLWEWLLVDRKPRIYLSGAGGSGKSTLAYEFMEQVALNCQNFKLRNGGVVDFVLFISAKETELNIRTGSEQSYQLRQFSNSRELYENILTSMFAEEAASLKRLSDEVLLERITEMFDNYNGLLVIDDIDALSRSGLDTGEEEMFLLSSQARKIVKIIYTLRNDASYAKNAAISVPGLDFETEVPDFINACCNLFNTSQPSEAQVEEIASETSCLPLLIETIVGLRTNGSNYEQALRDFREKGGDAARKYLYQREYDKLHATGRGRQVLATLMAYDGSLSFDSICALTNSDADTVRSAINETANIFLKITTDEDGLTAYSLSPSAAGFVRSVSKHLPYFRAVTRAVDHFRKDTARSTPREASIISKMEQDLRAKRFDKVIAVADDLDALDAVRVNPKFMSILGQALVQSDYADLTKARELFKAADSFGYRDIFTLRAWFHAERKAGYRYAQAVEVCEKVVKNPKYSDRYRSEFSSKIGECKSAQARSLSGGGNPDKITLFAEAISHYLNAMHFANTSGELDRSKTLDWLNRAFIGYVSCANGDFGFFFKALEEPVKTGLVVDAETAKVIRDQVSGDSRSRDTKKLRKALGTLNSGINLITCASGKRRRENISSLIKAIDESKKSFELRIMQIG